MTLVGYAGCRLSVNWSVWRSQKNALVQSTPEAFLYSKYEFHYVKN